ncbi:putative ABC transporter permease subunit [Paenibacillus sp. MBLB4367]|uniref:putative ABC transporter permease subunit n=1 Tax=Paenibacillus sp. MBLB4367 TaxID=3384767 RepID=UPI00390826E1
MNKTFSLTRMLWKSGSGLFGGTIGKSGSQVKRYLLIGLLFAAFLPLAFTLGTIIAKLYDALAPIGQEGSLLGLGLAVSSVVIFVFGIFYVINVYYFSQDVEHLLPLPVKPSQILAAKFSVTLVYQYVTELFLVGPLLIAFGIKSGAGPMFYLYGIVVFAALPVIPLVIASIIAMIVMRFTNVAKHKDRYRMIGGAVAVIIGLGANMLFQRYTRASLNQQELQDLLLSGNNSFMDTAVQMFPTVKFAATALMNELAWKGLAGLVLFVALSALVIVLFMLLGEWLYFRGVMGMSESGSKRKALSSSEFEKQTKQSSALKAYLVKEMRILLRTPAYFINCVLMCFLWPLLLLLPVLAQSGGTSALSSLADFIGKSDTTGVVLCVGIALFLFVAGANNTAPTAISREGSSMFVNKYLPVPYGTMIMAKALSGLLLCCVTMVLLLAAGAVLLHLPPLLVVLLAVAGIPGMLLVTLFGLLIDINFPKLHWDNEQKAVKQNINVLFSTLFSVAIAAVVVFLGFYFKLSLPIAFGGMFILFVGLNVVLYRILMTKGPVWLDRIEG